MKKVILIAVTIFLIVLIIFLWLLNRKNNPEEKVDNSFQNSQSSSKNKSIPSRGSGSVVFPTSLPNTGSSLRTQLQSVLPFSSEDVDIVYSPELKKFIITKKTAQADAAIKAWAEKNGFPRIFTSNPGLFIVRDVSKTPNEVVNGSIATLPQAQKDALNDLKNTHTVGDSFAVDYAREVDTFIVQNKTAKAEKNISQWARDKNVGTIVTNPDIFVKTSDTADSIRKKTLDTITKGAIFSGDSVEKKVPVEQISFNLLGSIFKMLPQAEAYKATPITLTPVPPPISEPSGNLNTNILSLIQGYGLPPPTADSFNGANGYSSLRSRLSSDSKAGWNTKALLNGERLYTQKGGSILSYLNTAWIWFENGASKYPDLYEINCRTGNDPASQVSAFCDSSNFQVAGYQPADRAGEFQRIFNQLYGGNSLTSVMQEVVKNSVYASQSKWSYLDGSQQKGSVASYLQNGTVPSTVSTSDISPSNGGLSSEKTQFYTLLLGKDPAMAAALNAPAVSSLPSSVFKQPIGSPSRPSWASYINATNMQLISNMIAALYLFDTNSSTLEPPIANGNPPELGAGGLVYYAQCGGQYDNYPLPNGGTFCFAGCGAATASMILSSYVDKSFIPPKVIGMYRQRGYSLGIEGSSIDDGKRIVESQGVKTSDYLFGQKLYTADIAGPMFKRYTDAGWTVFVVANFCEINSPKHGCGHLFWVVSVDANGTIWAYDAAYGQREIPLNENKKFPWPKYKAAFAVKKN